MTKNQFIAALKTLNYGHASQETAKALGLSVRQLQRLCSGESEVSDSIANLLAMYLKHGKPK